MKVYLQDVDKQLASARNSVKNSKISKRNKEIIFDFERYLAVNGIGKLRISKYLGSLKIIAQDIKKNFEDITKKDVEDFVGKLQQKDYSEWTKHDYKMILKKFFRWLKKNDTPEETSWISLKLDKTKIHLPAEGELLSEEDIQKLLENIHNLRDKAFVSVLYESGCRIGEIGTIRIKSIEFDNYGCLISILGKTGARKLRIINSTSYIANWINNHPDKNNKEAFVWVNIGHNKGKPLSYGAMTKMLNNLFKKAKLDKKCNPHIFRHSRATFLANYLTEFQMNQYFGWVQGSGMPATYIHMSGKNIDNALLKMNGVKLDEKESESKLKAQKCARCDTINSSEDKFCSRCGALLDLKEAMLVEEQNKDVESKRRFSDNIMNKLFSDPEVLSLISKKIQALE